MMNVKTSQLCWRTLDFRAFSRKIWEIKELCYNIMILDVIHFAMIPYMTGFWLHWCTVGGSIALKEWICANNHIDSISQQTHTLRSSQQESYFKLSFSIFTPSLLSIIHYKPFTMGTSSLETLITNNVSYTVTRYMCMWQKLGDNPECGAANMASCLRLIAATGANQLDARGAAELALYSHLFNILLHLKQSYSH